METYELEDQIHAGLTSNAELMSLLPLGAKSIYHYVAPSILPTKYPAVVYSPISDVPLLSGDNREIAHRVTIRIHVITSERITTAEQEKFLRACKLIRDVMLNLNFTRRQTTPYVEDGRTMIIYDYERSVES